MTVPAIAFPLLLAFWVFVCWRVRVERGVVHAPALDALSRFLRAMRDMQIAIGLALLPIVRQTVEALEVWNDTIKEMFERDPELRAALDALELPDGYTVAYDTTPLLEGGNPE